MELRYRCRMPQPEVGDQWFDDFEKAKSWADKNAQIGCTVSDADGRLLYSPVREGIADLLYHAKQACDYFRDNEFNYGDAPINPAINDDARLVSCDRLVGCCLYRWGWVDQPYRQGLRVACMRFANWCEEHGFARIDRVEDLEPGDICFQRWDANHMPAHAYLYAGKGPEEGMHYRYDGGNVNRLRSTQPSCEPIQMFLFAYRPVAPAYPVMPQLSFLYDGVPFAELEKKTETTGNGVLYTLPDGLQLECRITYHAKQRVIQWHNHWHNPTDHESGLITDLWDCDVTLPVAPDAPRTRRNKQSTWEPQSTLLYVTKGSNSKEDDGFIEPVRLWAGESRRYACENGRSAMGTAPYFDINRQQDGWLLGIGWTGQWNAIFDRTQDAVRVRIGIENAAFRVRPGEKFRTAGAALTNYLQGQDQGHNRWRSFMKEISPLNKGRGEHCPFSALFWGSVRSETLIARWKDFLKEKLPFELCWVDAGWYLPHTAAEENPTEKWWDVGDWTVSGEFHPDHFREVSAFLHENGKKLMLWAAPEHARPDILEWIRWLEGRDLHPYYPNKLVALCDDEVTDQVIEKVSSLITECGLDAYRQDFCVMPLDFWRSNDEPERAGITEIRHINNLYRFWDTLLQRFPQLLIDNCAGGGQRNDIEMLSRSVSLWRSDYQCVWDCCPEVNQNQNQCAAWWNPCSGIGFGPTLGDTYAWRSAYAPGLAVRSWELEGDEWNVGAAGEPLDWARKHFNEYLSVRDLLEKDFYMLLPPSKENTGWSVSQYYDFDNHRGMLLAFRRARSPYASAHVQPKDFELYAYYEFTDADTGKKLILNGTDINREGMDLLIPEQRRSMLLTYRALLPGMPY